MAQHGFPANVLALASAVFVLVASVLTTEASAQALGWAGARSSESYSQIGPPNYSHLNNSRFSSNHSNNSHMNYDAVASRQYQAPHGYQNRCSCGTSPAPAAPLDYSDYSSQYSPEPNAGQCDSYATAPYCANACAPQTVLWGGRVGALMLNREDENHRRFSFDSTDESIQLLDSRESNFEDGFGVEVHVFRRDLCSCVTLEGVYWGIFPEVSHAYAYPGQVAGNLDGILNFDQLNYYGVTADNAVNGAMVHRLRRETEIHNAELNRLWDLSPQNCSCSPGCSCSPWSVQFLAGLRYFRFSDNLQFSSDPVDTMFTGAADELYYTIDVDNDLFGFQLGGWGERQISSSRWSFTCGAKAGIFINDADAHSHIGGAAGTATVNNGPNSGAAWNVVSSKDDLALLAELQAGLTYRAGWNWRLRADYRVIAVSGVALPTNQIYQDLRGLQDVALLGTNGDLTLHGVFFGAERLY